MALSQDNTSTEKSSDEDTDFTSEKFNAFKALYKENVVAPFPNIQLFNNLSEYEREMKKPKPQSGNVQTKEENQTLAPIKSHKPRSVSSTSDLKSQSQSTETTSINKRRQPLDNVVLRMERCVKGPLSLLKRCRDEGILVRVWTRNAVAVRGICSGYIVAFDKHFNLAMFDVDEIMKKPVQPPDKPVGKKPCKKKKSIQDKSEAGDDKVCVSIAEKCEGPSKDDNIQTKHKRTEPVSNRKKEKQKPNSDKTEKNGESDQNSDEISEQMSHLGVSDSRTKMPVKKDKPTCKRHSYDNSLYFKRENETQISEIVHRHVNQLLVRGDNVVLVSIAEQSN